MYYQANNTTQTKLDISSGVSGYVRVRGGLCLITERVVHKMAVAQRERGRNRLDSHLEKYLLPT